MSKPRRKAKAKPPTGPGPRAYTAAEIRHELMSHLRTVVSEWERFPNKTVRERLEGVVFSTLVTFDGGVPFFPRMRVIPYPHPSDRKYNRSQGENWYPNDVDIGADKELHQEWCDTKRGLEST